MKPNAVVYRLRLPVELYGLVSKLAAVRDCSLNSLIVAVLHDTVGELPEKELDAMEAIRVAREQP